MPLLIVNFDNATLYFALNEHAVPVYSARLARISDNLLPRPLARTALLLNAFSAVVSHAVLPNIHLEIHDPKRSLLCAYDRKCVNMSYLVASLRGVFGTHPLADSGDAIASSEPVQSAGFMPDMRAGDLRWCKYNRGTSWIVSKGVLAVVVRFHAPMARNQFIPTLLRLLNVSGVHSVMLLYYGTDVPESFETSDSVFLLSNRKRALGMNIFLFRSYSQKDRLQHQHVLKIVHNELFLKHPCEDFYEVKTEQENFIII